MDFPTDSPSSFCNFILICAMFILLEIRGLTKHLTGAWKFMFLVTWPPGGRTIWPGTSQIPFCKIEHGTHQIFFQSFINFDIFAEVSLGVQILRLFSVLPHQKDSCKLKKKQFTIAAMWLYGYVSNNRCSFKCWL